MSGYYYYRHDPTLIHRTDTLCVVISIEVGKDADLVIWDHHPLTLGARPKHVVIDGVELEFDTSWAKHVDEEIQKPSSKQDEMRVQASASDHSLLPPKPATSMHVHDTKTACAPDVDTFVLRNISRLYAGPDQTIDGPVELAIKEGRVTCISTNCINDEKAAEFDLNGGVVIPVSYSLFDMSYILTLMMVLFLRVFSLLVHPWA